ncbi:E3 ubiquitin-protein ligase At1g63170 [Nicotiana tabacum]|uniref:RING-type E3 ubiquitin transferase n=2 Tax=Nicotiana TaxID=4085 RepID=A0A1S4BIK3_TOBAC|nr:PREDICTED: E3 ubiquitin-protein ligase At1g63170-like [Nicotiana sylvestris]XP_016488705.1 PREDICTED: E3 ubiquitin-protein ligase At1g63170-like [Nicotiana tabacum]
MSTARVAADDNTSNADVSPSNGGGGVDTSPLLTNSRSQRSFHRRPSLRGAAGFLRRASSRRLMREPSMRVREAAAEQIEERQSDWAYSKPIVILDLVWNLAFVIVAISVLIMSKNESPSMPLRLWIIGYALQSVLHMVCVFVEYRRRCQRRNSSSSSGNWNNREVSNLSSESDGGESGDYLLERRQNEDETSVAKHLESANTMFSFIWWIIGFYWVSAGGQTMTRDAPQLYWLCITFLAFDVFFVVICVAVACVIGIAVCCCLPCIIAILYAVADQEGATKEDVERLTKYKFRRLGNFEKENGEIQESFGGVMVECDTDTPTEHVLPPEDAECCICICSYEDGAELRELPCRHHFHAACIDKWLYINATCPLCKFNILKNGNQSGSEEA